MHEANKKLVVDYLEAMGNGDRAAFAACLAPDATATCKGYAKISGDRDYENMVGSVEAFKHIWVGGLKPEFKSLTADEDRVVAEFEGNATLPDGTPYRNQYAMIFTIKNGKIQHCNEYLCTVLADQVMLPALVKHGMWQE